MSNYYAIDVKYPADDPGDCRHDRLRWGTTHVVGEHYTLEDSTAFCLDCGTAFHWRGKPEIEVPDGTWARFQDIPIPKKVKP